MQKKVNTTNNDYKSSRRVVLQRSEEQLASGAHRDTISTAQKVLMRLEIVTVKARFSDLNSAVGR